MNSALVVMDVTEGAVARLGDRAGEFVGEIREAIAGARAAHIPVVYTRLGFRDGAPELSTRNKIHRLVVGDGRVRYPEAGVETQIHAGLEPRSDEVVVVKRRVSAFTGSDLDVVLRGRDIDSLVLCGTATSAVVLATFLQAADMDYDLTVLANCCRDPSPVLHLACLAEVFPRQGEVMDSKEWIRTLEEHA